MDLIIHVVAGIGSAIATAWAWVCALQWNQFIPDLIVAAFTGLVVGFLIWRYQERAASRRQHEADLEWVNRLESIDRILRTNLDITPNAFQPPGELLRRIEDLARGSRLAHPGVTKSNPELAMLPALADCCEALRLAAEHLEVETERITNAATSVGRLGLDARNYVRQIREGILSHPWRRWALLDPPPYWDETGLPEDIVPILSDYQFYEATEHYRKQLKRARVRWGAFAKYRWESSQVDFRRGTVPFQARHQHRWRWTIRRAERSQYRQLERKRVEEFGKAMETMSATIDRFGRTSSPK